MEGEKGLFSCEEKGFMFYFFISFSNLFCYNSQAELFCLSSFKCLFGIYDPTVKQTVTQTDFFQIIKIIW